MMQLSETIVDTSSGRLRGCVDGNIATFLGVPFAEAPVGPLRFQAPEPVTAWSGVREALDFGPTAPQPERGDTLVPEPVVPGDLYLNLNIDTPGRAGDGLPVIVWIHGGGFFGGCNRSPWYRGHRFARDGVVFVSVNYRLGAEGFMPIPGAPDNRGVLDWIAALRWVRENIEAFGGDPDNVTIAGQSAGGAACTYLLTIPRARGLVRRVIAMSGSRGVGLSRAGAEEIGRDFSHRLGVAYEVGALAGTDIARFLSVQAELTGPDASVMRSPLDAVLRFSRGLPFQPVVDGDLIPRSSAEAIRAGVGADIPVLLSVMAEEFDFVMRGGGSTISGAQRDNALVRLGLEGEAAADYRSLHAGLPDDALLGRAITDRMFRAPVVLMAEARAEAAANTYVSEFRWAPAPLVPDALGACHCLDIPFVFDLLDAPGVDRIAGPRPPEELARHLHRAWIDFASAGDPGWPAYRPEDRVAQIIVDEAESRSDPFASDRRVWAKGRCTRH